MRLSDTVSPARSRSSVTWASDESTVRTVPTGTSERSAT